MPETSGWIEANIPAQNGKLVLVTGRQQRHRLRGFARAGAQGRDRGDGLPQPGRGGRRGECPNKFSDVIWSGGDKATSTYPSPGRIGASSSMLRV